MRKASKKAVLIVLSVLLAFSAFALAACGKEGPSVTTAEITVELDKGATSLAVGAAEQLAATVKKDGAVVTDETVTWTSADEAVATVSSSGLVTAVAPGNTTVTAAVGEKTAACTVTVTAAPEEVVWKGPDTQFTIQNDVVKFRPDRAEAIDAQLAQLVTAKQNGEGLNVIVDNPGTFVLGEDNTYPIGEHTVTYKTRTLGGENKTWEYKIKVVDGKAVDYYVFGKNSATYTNANWQGGIGIRVADSDTFIIPAGAEAMPEAFLNSSNGKLLDRDDPMLVINRSESDITFQVNDVSGVHVLMDRAGFVKMVYEGIQNDFWDEAGQSRKTPSEFGSEEKTLRPGDIYFVVGSTESGNYYCRFDSSTTEKHWRDGRFIAKNTIAGPRYGNVAQIKLGDTLITDEYTNQKPYLLSGGDTLQLVQGEAFTEAALTAGVTFYDDNGVYGIDTQVPADLIEVTNNIDIDTVGEYSVTYVVTDSTDSALKMTYVRKVKVVAPLISYVRYSANDAINTKEIKKLFWNNADYAAADNDTLFVYDTNFSGTKADNVQFNAFVVVGADGKVKAMLNGNGGFWGADGAMTTAGYGNTNQLQYFKLNDADTAVAEKHYALQPGDRLYFGRHTGAPNNVRDFFQNYITAVNANAEGSLAAKTIALTVNVNYNYTAGGAVRFMNIDTLRYNDADYAKGKNATAFVYDRNFTGAKPSAVNYTNLIVLGADGKVKAMLNGNGGFWGADGVMVTAGYGATNQLQYFKLNDADTAVAENYYALQEGDILIFARHTGADDTIPQASNFRAFLGAYIDAVKNNAGGNLAEKSIPLNSPQLIAG